MTTTDIWILARDNGKCGNVLFNPTYLTGTGSVRFSKRPLIGLRTASALSRRGASAHSVPHEPEQNRPLFSREVLDEDVAPHFAWQDCSAANAGEVSGVGCPYTLLAIEALGIDRIGSAPITNGAS